MHKIGIITTLHTFPVAEMNGEQVEILHINTQGVEGNRILGFTDESQNLEYTWMTPAQKERFTQYHAFHAGVEKKAIKVKTPEGEVFDVQDINLLALLIGENNHLLELRNLQPSHTISLACTNDKQANIHISLDYDIIKQKHLDQKIVTLGQKVKIKTYLLEELLIGSIIIPGIVYPNDPVFLL